MARSVTQPEWRTRGFVNACPLAISHTWSVVVVMVNVMIMVKIDIMVMVM